MSKRANPQDQTDIELEDSKAEIDRESPEYQAKLKEFSSGAKVTKQIESEPIQGEHAWVEPQKIADVPLKSNASVKMIITGRMVNRDRSMKPCNFYMTKDTAERVNRLCSGNKGLMYNKLINIALDAIEESEGVLIYTEKDI